MSYLAIARAAESRMRMERDPGAVLTEAYRKYWSLPESDPMETFKALHREIDILERQVEVEVAWRTLEEAARAWYEEHRACPFCKHPNVLHFEKGVPK